MACNSCGKAFSLLRKEKGCPSCGFSYCSKCLVNKIFVPKLSAEAKVCAMCKRSASNSNESKIVVEPPDAYYRRMGLKDDKQSNIKTTNTVIDSKDQYILERLQKLKVGRNDNNTTDDVIRSRLQNIKGEMVTASDAEIQGRLAKLRGVPTSSMTSKPVLINADTRSEQEQADDLLKQYVEQTNMDAKYKDEFDGLISDMELRMQKLKGSDPTTSKESGDEKFSKNAESEDEEESVQKIVAKIRAEAALEEDEPSISTTDELPFCEICNEDARMRCLGCRYLFCKRCFLEHKDDDECNSYEPYHAPKSN